MMIMDMSVCLTIHPSIHRLSTIHSFVITYVTEDKLRHQFGVSFAIHQSKDGSPVVSNEHKGVGRSYSYRHIDRSIDRSIKKVLRVSSINTLRSNV